MANIPKSVADRFANKTAKYIKVLKAAYDRDINEADTVNIVTEILSDVFGFDKFTEITREYAIRHTYCDLAIKIKDEVKFLIEVKSISTALKDMHIRQAIDYGAKEGIQWVVLTNGLIWEAFNIQMKKKVEYNKVFEIDFNNIKPRSSEAHEMLFLLAKEGLGKDVISEYHERVKCVNPYVIGALLISDTMLSNIKRELRRITPKLKIENDEIEMILKNEVLKRSTVEGADALEAQRIVRKSANKILRKSSQVIGEGDFPSPITNRN